MPSPSKKDNTSDGSTPPAAVHKPPELNKNVPPFKHTPIVTKDDDKNKSDGTAATATEVEATLPPLVDATATDVTDADEKMASPSPKKKPKWVKESVIDHTYRDFSHVEVDASDDDKVEGSTPKQQNFPTKLHEIVSNPNYQHIICWQPHGRSWKIVDKHLLSTLICPKHFAHAKFESFNRSVNGWGFKVGDDILFVGCVWCMCMCISFSMFPDLIVFEYVHLLQPKAPLESRTGKLLNAYL